MKNAQQAVRLVMILVALFFFLGVMSGCPSYTPKKTGICNHSRVWVEPSKGDDGEWKAGYCKDIR